MDYTTHQQNRLPIEEKLEEVPLHHAVALDNAMHAAALVSNLIDELGKVILHRREPDMDELNRIAQSLVMVAEEIAGCVEVGDLNAGDTMADFREVDVRLLHHAFGRFGKAGELVSALHRQSLGCRFDVVHYVEKMGEGAWYEPLAYEALDINEECVRVAKLAKILIVDYNKGCSGDASGHRRTSEREVIQWVIDHYESNGMPTGIGKNVLQICRDIFCSKVAV